MKDLKHFKNGYCNNTRLHFVDGRYYVDTKSGRVLVTGTALTFDKDEGAYYVDVEGGGFALVVTEEERFDDRVKSHRAVMASIYGGEENIPRTDSRGNPIGEEEDDD